MDMKKLFSSIAIIIAALLLTAYPVKLGTGLLTENKQYNELINYTKKDLHRENQRLSFYVFYGSNGAKDAREFLTETETLNDVQIFRFNTNTDLISGIYCGVDKLDYETVMQTAAGRTTYNARTLKVKNADCIPVNNRESLWDDSSLNVGSYELPQMLAEDDYLNCKDGRYPDYTHKQTAGSTVEVMVTDGLGLSVGDTFFMSLDALDENENLVVVKATVVGIADKGIFLPYYERHARSSDYGVAETYNRVFNGEMIYYTDLSNLYSCNSNLLPEERDFAYTADVIMVRSSSDSAKAVTDTALKHNAIISTMKLGLFDLHSDMSEFRLLNIGSAGKALPMAAALFALSAVVLAAAVIFAVVRLRKKS